MRRALLVLTLLPLPGCLTKALWRSDPAVFAVDLQRADFAVESLGLDAGVGPAPGHTPATGLLVQATRTRGRCTAKLEPRLSASHWLSLRFDDPAQALAIEELLLGEPLGPIDRCTIELEWTLTPEREQFWDGRLEIRGELSPRSCGGAIDETAAAQLLAAAIAAGDVTAPELPRCLAAAERIDWRVLLPFEADGKGKVLACLAHRAAGGPAATDTIAAIDLLIRVRSTPPYRYLRVPAAVTPVLAAVDRAPTILQDRFVLRARCRPRPVAEPPSFAALAAPPDGTTLALLSNAEAIGNRTGLLEKILLTPFTVVVDTAVEVLMHGRWPAPQSPNIPPGGR